jgi:hypothetical protein
MSSCHSTIPFTYYTRELSDPDDSLRIGVLTKNLSNTSSGTTGKPKCTRGQASYILHNVFNQLHSTLTNVINV